MDPAGVFGTSYPRDQALIRTRKQAVALLVFLALLLLLPQLLGPRLVAMGSMMLISAIVVVGLQINTGYAGQVNLGQAAFMGVGAYVAAVCATKAGLPFWLSIGVLAIVAVILWGYTRRRHLMDVDDSDFLQPRAVRDKFLIALAVLSLAFLFAVTHLQPIVLFIRDMS